MDLDLSEHLRDGYAIAKLRGELDIYNAPGLRERLLGILAERVPRLILDLSGLAFIDSTGISVLVAAERRAHELGGTFSLVGPRKMVAKVLNVTSLDKHFRIFPTVDDAIIAGHENGPPVAAT
jgi:anti-sigma B factor antagonist